MTIQPGTYAARATDAVLGYTSNGSEQVAVAFVLLDDKGQQTVTHITWYGFFTEKTTERTIQALRHCGWQGDDLSELSTVGSADVELVIDDEPDLQGQMRTRVRWVNALGSSAPAIKDRMGDAQRKAFAAKMRGMVVAANGGKASPRPAAPARAPQRQAPRDDAAAYAPPIDDDSPF